eukprot:CAMPEP_0195536360 /NCGR_PEP_ID=MMETSP0794_2-20130614/45946_1 /TAXON_ID=515487 /ORGANISM="Stephanopyxis turris, Strain CCMP 815" /LENGTH=55 /DNA_ID=CAMNT_0040669749 /DNA_START=254 /DNA_END=421 /DNA_ORIENTATION=+
MTLVVAEIAGAEALLTKIVFGALLASKPMALKVGFARVAVTVGRRVEDVMQKHHC